MAELALVPGEVASVGRQRLRKGAADAPAVPEDEAPPDGLDKLTVAQLREQAAELGVDPTGKKADLLALIRGAIAAGVPRADEGEEGEGASDEGDGKANDG